MNSQRLFLRNLLIIYILLFIVFLVWGYSYFPAWYDALIQILMLFMGIPLFFITQKKKSNIFIVIFIYHLLCSFVMIEINHNVYGDIYGYNPDDAELYRSYGNIFYSKTFSEALNYLTSQNIVLDDFGYPLIIFLSKKIFGDYFLTSIVFFNALAVGFASVFLHKLASIFIPKIYSSFIAIAWGIMPYGVYTTAAGLKENFFALFIILSFYYLYRAIKVRNFNSYVLFILFTFITFLFRLVIGYAIVLAFFSFIILNNKYIFKYYKYVILFIVFIIPLVFRFIGLYIINQRGYEFDVLLELTTEKVGGTLGTIINYVAGFIGPFPSFISSSSEKITYITRYSFSSFFKMIISFYFWLGTYRIIKNKEIIFFPMIVFYAINTTMLIFTFYTLHDRYQWPHIPIYFIIATYGYIEYQKSKRVRKCYSIYVLCTLLMIFVYNFR